MLLADMLAVERQEAALIWQVQADGLAIEHRADANPRAVLGVELAVAA